MGDISWGSGVWRVKLKGDDGIPVCGEPASGGDGAGELATAGFDAWAAGRFDSDWDFSGIVSCVAGVSADGSEAGPEAENAKSTAAGVIGGGVCSTVATAAVAAATGLCAGAGVEGWDGDLWWGISMGTGSAGGFTSGRVAISSSFKLGRKHSMRSQVTCHSAE